MKNIFAVPFVVLFLGIVSSAVLAADCKQVIQTIQQERNFLKRKNLVAEAIVTCPDDPIIVFKYAFSQERFNHLEEAIKYYQKAVELDPNMAKAFFGMADVYVTLGKKQMALIAYIKGLALDPTNVRAIRSKTAVENELAGK